MKRLLLTLFLVLVMVLPLTVQAQAHPAPYRGVWLGANELAALPTSGTAWNALKATADKPLGSIKLSNQDDNNDQILLAKALVYARTGDAAYRAAVVAGLKAVPQTENGGRTLALARNLLPIVVAADLINLPDADPAFAETFRTWLKDVRHETLDGRTLVSTHEDRPNNWGTHAGASRIAAAIYLDDEDDLDRAATVFRGWLGDRSAYSGFSYGELDWQCNEAAPVGINPKGCVKAGINIDGAQPEEMRRGGGLKAVPAETGYPWEALQGSIASAWMLHRQGYSAFAWQDQAILRSVEYLYRIGWPAEGDDTWQVWIINSVYGTNFPTTSPVTAGKNIGWTDWTHSKATVVTPVPQPTTAPEPTAVPEPVETETPQPQDTPTPASTPQPVDTETPQPTTVPQPAATETPQPDETPNPYPEPDPYPAPCTCCCCAECPPADAGEAPTGLIVLGAAGAGAGATYLVQKRKRTA